MNLEVRILQSTPQTIASVQRIAESNPDYYLAVTGALPTPTEGENLFSDSDLPASIQGKERIQLGFFHGNNMLAVADILRGHRNPDSAWIGWLLIHKNNQGQGLGRQCFRLIKTFVQSQWPDITHLTLSVVETNTPALTFWPHMGFIEAPSREPYTHGNLQTFIRIFHYKL